MLRAIVVGLPGRCLIKWRDTRRAYASYAPPGPIGIMIVIVLPRKKSSTCAAATDGSMKTCDKVARVVRRIDCLVMVSLKFYVAAFQPNHSARRSRRRESCRIRTCALDR